MSNSFATPQTVACQASLPMEFSWPEYWSGLPFPTAGGFPDSRIELESPALAGRFFTTEPLLLLLLSRFSPVWLLRPHRGQLTSLPSPRILQARTLEWVAIAFSNAWKWKVKVKSLSRVWLLATPWTAAYQAPLPMAFSRQEYWNGLPLPSLWATRMPKFTCT